MSKYKAILQELARTAFNYPAGELSELFKKTDEELTDEDVAEIGSKLNGQYRSTITSINKTAELKLDEKFKEGQRRKAKEFENLLKDKFSVDSDKEGQELIEDIVLQYNEKNKSKGGKELTEDDVKRHPAYLRMHSELKKQLDQAKEEKDNEIKKLQSDYQKKEVFGEFSKYALGKIDELNPVLSEDPAKAQKQKELILEKLSGYEFEKVDGKFIAIKDGKRAENEFGHEVEVDELIKSTTTSYYDVRKAEERKAPNGSEGGKQPEGGKQHSYTGKLPKTEAEYRTMMEDGTLDLKAKMAINDHWEKQAASA